MKKANSEFNKKTSGDFLHKYKLIALIALSSIALLFAGCQGKNKVTDNTDTKNNQTEDSKISESESNETEKKETVNDDNKEADNNDTVNDGNKEAQNGYDLFKELSAYQFVFASGAGAWQTTLNIYEDGSFSGYYSDSDMGVTGEDYPNGTVSECTFNGKFTAPVKINDYTYSTTIENINYEKEVGDEEIIDGIKYTYTEPYGLNDAKEIYIYTPKAPLKELPEDFRGWVGFYNLSDADEYLPFYGLYNAESGYGFSSYILDEEENIN